MGDLGKSLPLLMARQIHRWLAERPNVVAAVLRHDALIDELMLDMTGMQYRLTTITLAVRVTEMKPQQTSSKHCFN